MIQCLPIACGLLVLAGCASFGRKDDRDKEIDALRLKVSELSTKVDQIEVQFNALNDSLDAKKVTQETMEEYKNLPSKTTKPTGTKAPQPVVIEAPIADATGSDTLAPSAPEDPGSGFASDPAVQAYRKAITLFRAGKLPESVVAFSSFIENYPDHPLAGSAQYFVGASYLQEKEYKLAAQEYRRVLTSYDRSSHVADALRDLAEAEDHLKLKEESARHRELLSSLFPQSPAAAALAGREPQGEPEGGPTAQLDAPPAPAGSPAQAGVSVAPVPVEIPAAEKPRPEALENPPTVPLDPPPAENAE